MFIYEMLYSSMKLVKYTSLFPSPFNIDLIETKFGKFKVRPYTTDMSNVSPSFERRDINYLIRLLSSLTKQKHRVLFLDIGADIGTFAITVGNLFKDYRNLSIMAFEPSPSSYQILQENIRLNGLHDKVNIYNVALFSEDNRELAFLFNSKAPGSSGLKFTSSDNEKKMSKVVVRTLDSLIAEQVNDYDILVLKLDVEGVEGEVLDGAKQILNAQKEVYLLLEDFVNPDIIEYLEKTGARFIRKLTPYNSWWYYCT
jgi:FkbM family methyltransferase